MLDQGLAGEGGGFRVNWTEDSDEPNRFYQNAIDSPVDDPQKLSPRYKRVISIILKRLPAIVCVQECDRVIPFTNIMKESGYETRFTTKTASATTGAGVSAAYKADNGIFDGMDSVGIMWNPDRFEEVFGPRPILLPNGKKGNLETWGKQAAMWMLLKNKRSGRIYAVVCAHKKSGKEKGEDKDVKRTQAKRMAEILRDELGEGVPIIFGCDFNNPPTTESYKLFRKELPFMAEAYEEVYGQSPSWGSSKWRSGGGQKHKIGHTPNNIDFIFYNRRFLKARAVLAYPNEHLEPDNLPGWKYPSDHFAHMATFEEVDKFVPARDARIAEFHHILKRACVVDSMFKPCPNCQGCKECAGTGKILKEEITYPKEYNFPTSEGVFKTVLQYREFLNLCEKDQATPKSNLLEYIYAEPVNKVSGEHGELVENMQSQWTEETLKELEKLRNMDKDITPAYSKCVDSQVRELRRLQAEKYEMQKDGEVYRTYTILKHMILNQCGRLGDIGKTQMVNFMRKNGPMTDIKEKIKEVCDIENIEVDKKGNLTISYKAESNIGEDEKKELEENLSTAPTVLSEYAKFDTLEITDTELEHNLTDARVMWLKKYFTKKARGRSWPKDYTLDGADIHKIVNELDTTDTAMEKVRKLADELEKRDYIERITNDYYSQFQFGKGDIVYMSGLQKDTILAPLIYNGRQGIVEKCATWDCDSGRWTIRLDDAQAFKPSGSTKSELISVKHQNLKKQVPFKAGDKVKFAKDITEKTMIWRTEYTIPQSVKGEVVPFGMVNGMFSDKERTVRVKTTDTKFTDRELNVEPKDLIRVCRLMEEDIPRASYLHSAEEVLARRRLVEHARMEAKHVNAMSSSELIMHRRRLAYGTRVFPVLAALMDEINAQRLQHGMETLEN